MTGQFTGKESSREEPLVLALSQGLAGSLGVTAVRMSPALGEQAGLSAHSPLPRPPALKGTGLSSHILKGTVGHLLFCFFFKT